MSDIKLFRITTDGARELQGTSIAIEKTLQTLIERHLETLLGVRFLASEYSTGKAHGGRVDTLGIDENNAPVIIEYKRAVNENVINQGLFYLDWLLDHKAEFKQMVMERLGNDQADAIDWRFTRLLCIAAGFNRYDEHAVLQISRNIELLRYRRYGDDLLVLELVNATTARPIDESATSIGASAAPVPPGERDTQDIPTVSDRLAAAGPDLIDRYESIKAFLLALGDDVQVKVLRHYIAFQRIKNFACIQVRPQAGTILIYVKVDPDSISLEQGFTHDVRSFAHGKGDLEITIHNNDDFERAKPYLLRSYEVS